MEEELRKDLQDGLVKMGEIIHWMLRCITVDAGQEKHRKQKKEREVVVVNNNADTHEEVALKSNYKNIYRRKDGRWEYIKKIDGIKTYAIASTKEKLLEKVREGKSKKREIKKKLVFIDWCKKWLEVYKQDLRESSKKRYKQIVEKYMEPFFKNTLMENVTQEQVQVFINGMKGERNKEYAFITVRQILKQAYINRKITEDISGMLVKPRKYRHARRTALSMVEQQEFMKVLKTYEPDVQIFMMFSIILGTRRAETLAFRLEDINELTKKVHIRGTKTYGADRFIKISDDMIQLLHANRQKRKNQTYFKYNPDYYTKIIQEIYETAGIQNKTLHDLRHTCSTNLLYLGVADKFRQQYLGHANIVMTNDIYTNLQDDITVDGLVKLYNNLYPKF